MPRGELRALTSVRGIAAWLVVLYHVRQSVAWPGEWPLAIVSRGYLAVDFFFLLSGFVLWLSWGDRLRSGGIHAAPAFLWRRFARIWPLHAVILSGGVMLALLLAATGRHDAGQFPFAELPLHYLLVQNWGFTDALAWNDPAWSISVETAAYLIFPLLVIAIDWRRLPMGVAIGAVAAMLATLHLIYAGWGSASLNDDITRLGLTRCLFEFSAGTALAAIWSRIDDHSQAVRSCLVIVAVTATAFALGAPETLAMPLMFAAFLLLLALVGDDTPLAARPLHWLGQISYATYLSHFLLWKAFKLVFVAAAGSVAWPLMSLYFVIVLAISAASFHGIEKPAQRWLNARRFPRPLIRIRA